MNEPIILEKKTMPMISIKMQHIISFYDLGVKSPNPTVAKVVRE
jgi:hypothetical protein